MRNLAMHVFTYGSLMYPEVWERVVRGRYRSSPATASGFARFAVKDETYPGMVPTVDGSVQGIVYFDVAVEDVQALDAFEGEHYRRDAISVTLENGESTMAGTYIFLPVDMLSASPWEPESFAMQRFLDTYCKVRLGG